MRVYIVVLYLVPFIIWFSSCHVSFLWRAAAAHKVLKDGERAYSDTSGVNTQREAGRWQKCTQWTGTVVEANVPTSPYNKEIIWLRGCCGKWLLELQPSSLLLAK